MMVAKKMAGEKIAAKKIAAGEEKTAGKIVKAGGWHDFALLTAAQ